MRILSKRFALMTLALGMALSTVPGTGWSKAMEFGVPTLEIEQSTSAPGCMRNPPPSQC